MCYVVGLSSLSKVKIFFFLSRRGERGCAFAVFFAPFLEKGILDYIAHRPIIQIFTVVLMTTPPLSPRPSAKQIHPLSHYAIFIHIKKY